MATTADIYKKLGKNTYRIFEKHPGPNDELHYDLELDPGIRIDKVRVSEKTGRVGMTIASDYHSIAIRERPRKGNIQAEADWLETSSGIQTTGTRYRWKAIKWAEKKLLERLTARLTGQLEDEIGEDEEVVQDGRDKPCEQLPRIFRNSKVRQELLDEKSEYTVQMYERILNTFAVVWAGRKTNEPGQQDRFDFIQLRTGRRGLLDGRGRPITLERPADPNRGWSPVPAIFDRHGDMIDHDRDPLTDEPLIGFVPEAHKHGALYDSNGNRLTRWQDRSGRRRYGGTGYVVVWPESMVDTGKNLMPASETQAYRDLTELRAVLNHMKEAELIGTNPLSGVKKLKKAKKRGSRASYTVERYIWTMRFADQADPTGRLRFMVALAYHTGHRIGAIRALMRRHIGLTYPEMRRLIAMAQTNQENEYDLEADAAQHFTHGLVAWIVDKQDFFRVTPFNAELRKEFDRFELKRKEAFGDSKHLFPALDNADQPISADDGIALLRDAEEAARRYIASQSLNPERFVPHYEGSAFHPYRSLWEVIREGLGYVNNRNAAYAGGWTTNIGGIQHSVYGAFDPRLVFACVEGVPFAEALAKYGIAEEARRDAQASPGNWTPKDGVDTQGTAMPFDGVDPTDEDWEDEEDVDEAA